MSARRLQRHRIGVILVTLVLAAAACTSEKKPTPAAPVTTSPTEAPAVARAPEKLPAADPDAKKFEEALLRIEINATDGDAGMQPFLDHDAWKWVALYAPDGSKLFEVLNSSELEQYGLTELFSESSEPPFKEFPFSEFKKLFPEGEYTFVGETIDDEPLRSTVTFAHEVPRGPKITSPTEDQRFGGQPVIRWRAVTKPAGIDIKGYQVIVETEKGPLRVLQADLPADAREFVVPESFARPGKYKVEVMAKEENGNQTLSEVPFSVA